MQRDESYALMPIFIRKKKKRKRKMNGQDFSLTFISCANGFFFALQMKLAVDKTKSQDGMFSVQVHVLSVYPLNSLY